MSKKPWAARLDISCGECREELAEYVRRELAGEAVETLFPAVAYHIETCPSCEAMYFRLFHTAGMQKSLAELRMLGDRQGVSAHFDAVLASLPAADEWTVAPVPHGRAWYDDFSRQLRQLEVQLVGLFTRPPLAPAEVLKGLQSSAPAGEADTPPAASIAEGELDIALRILPDAHGEVERCRIEVAVQREGSFGDYSGIEVSLAHAAGEQTETTDELGHAWFDGVPRDESTPLVLTVRLP